ncbi:MAG: tetratricopeptide repeat protein [Planctomycetota bacterium]|nr:tetratricopeptide repeat protein [Planctomycetota bacterium]
MRLSAASEKSTQQPRWLLRGAVCLILALVLFGSGCRLTPDGNVVQVELADVIGSGQVHYHQAMQAYRKGDVERAIRLFEKTLRGNHMHASAHNNLGLALYERRQLAAAAEHFQFAIELRPEDPKPINNLGMALEAGGRVHEAIELYSEAVAMNPNSPLYLGNLLRARVRLGEQSPELLDDLQYLAFIETRPDWVEWVDEVLALHLNPALDRGPKVEETPLQSENRDTLAPVVTMEEIQGEIIEAPAQGDSATPAEIWQQLQAELPSPR